MTRYTKDYKGLTFALIKIPKISVSNASRKIAKISELGVSNAFRATRRELGHYTRLVFQKPDDTDSRVFLKGHFAKK